MNEETIVRNKENKRWIPMRYKSSYVAANTGNLMIKIKEDK